MMLKRMIPVFATSGLVLAACASEPPPPPEPEIRVDTVVVTREVPPPLPEGRPASVCLATGQEVQIYISPRGDTLVGPQRTALRELRGVSFAGTYAADQPWFNADEAITFDDRRYEKFGTEESMDCDDIEIVGSYSGVNLFASAGMDMDRETIYVPVRPGVFQAYRGAVGRVRG